MILKVTVYDYPDESFKKEFVICGSRDDIITKVFDLENFLLGVGFGFDDKYNDVGCSGRMFSMKRDDGKLIIVEIEVCEEMYNKLDDVKMFILEKIK